MTGLPGNLGGINFEDLIKILKNARDTGRTVLQSAIEALANNPQLKGIVDQLRGLLGKPVIELTDAELDDLINARHAGNQAKSNAWPEDEPAPPPPPPPPPPPTNIFDSDPGMQTFPANVWRSSTTPPKFLIHSGRVGDPIPSQFSPPIPGEEEPGWKILHQSQR